MPAERLSIPEDFSFFFRTYIRKAFRISVKRVCHGLIAVIVAVIAVFGLAVSEDMSHTFFTPFRMSAVMLKTWFQSSVLQIDH